jgi:SAM-dependent methyltransferase
MDKQTFSAYDLHANAYANDWCAQPEPSDLYALIQEYFKPGLTADVGCGVGRDTAWLNAHGYEAIGYDASEGLLAEARQRYPNLEFKFGLLPDLSGIENDRFTNVLCETVIMHLNHDMVAAAVQRMMEILTMGGTLYLSWRTHGDGGDAAARDDKGRLYSNIDVNEVLRAVGNASILLNQSSTNQSSGKLIHRIVVRK